MELLKVHDWDDWQSYRKDRGQPPWIKVHRCLLRDPKWVSLSDVEKAHLLSIWMLAADKGGTIPNDATLVKRLCCLEEEVNLNKFIFLGLLDTDWLASGCQDGVTCESYAVHDGCSE